MSDEKKPRKFRFIAFDEMLDSSLRKNEPEKRLVEKIFATIFCTKIATRSYPKISKSKFRDALSAWDGKNVMAELKYRNPRNQDTIKMQ